MVKVSIESCFQLWLFNFHELPYRQPTTSETEIMILAFFFRLGLLEGAKRAERESGFHSASASPSQGRIAFHIQTHAHFLRAGRSASHSNPVPRSYSSASR